MTRTPTFEVVKDLELKAYNDYVQSEFDAIMVFDSEITPEMVAEKRGRWKALFELRCQMVTEFRTS